MNSINRNLFKIVSVVLTMIFVLSAFSCVTFAGSNDYPVQQIRITAQNGKNLNITGYSDNSPLNVWSSNGNANERWFLKKNSDGAFNIINTYTGRLVSTENFSLSEGSTCVLYGDASKEEQRWNFVGVTQDVYGNFIEYKIVNSCNENMVLTLNNDRISISAYTGSASQKWKINSDGLEGFAAECTDMSGNVKACTTGGLFGDIVFVDNISDFVNYVSDTVPRTVVVSSNLDSNSKYTVNLGANKTIIGTYGVYLNNILMQTGSSSENIIFKNLNLKHSVENNQNNVIYISTGVNYWIDHCTFEGHDFSKDENIHKGDIDKLLNVRDTADFVTVSYSKFTGHKYGLLFGYPDDDSATVAKYNGYPRLTFAFNRLDEVITRGPGLLRHGFFHIYNNYVTNFDMGYTIHTNSKLYSEKNYFEAGSGKGSVVNDDAAAYFTDSGSYPSITNIKSVPTDFRPTNNYSYKSINVSEVPNFDDLYSGVSNSASNVNYINFDKKGVPSSSFVTYSDYEEQTQQDVLTDGALYMIKNQNSGLYLEIEGGKFSSGTNVQQWGANGNSAHNTWKAVKVEDGYYQFVSVGGDQNMGLDIAAGSKNNGANIQIWGISGGNHQMFKPVLNSDGSCVIYTKITNDSSCIEVADGSGKSGANIQQNKFSGESCQNWYFEKIS